MDEITKYALDYGTMGIMAYVFFWLYLRQQKKIDQMHGSQKEEEDKIRDRFKSVIEKYDSERDQLLKERFESLAKLQSEVYNLKEKINKISKD